MLHAKENELLRAYLSGSRECMRSFYLKSVGIKLQIDFFLLNNLQTLRKVDEGTIAALFLLNNLQTLRKVDEGTIAALLR